MKTSLMPLATSLNVNVTQLCNLACRYCAAGGDGTYGAAQLKVDIEKVIPKLGQFLREDPQNTRSQRPLVVTLLGGEPLLYPKGVEALCEYVRTYTKGRQVRLRLVTNGTLLNEANLQLLAKYQVELAVSLDGVPEVQNRVRGRGQDIATVIEEGLKRAQTYRSRLGRITVNTVFGRHNTEVSKTYVYLRSFNFDEYRFLFDEFERDSKVVENYLEEFRNFTRELSSSGRQAELLLIEPLSEMYYRIDSGSKRQKFCGSEESFFALDVKGQVAGCTWWLNSEHKNKLLSDSKLQSIYLSSTAQDTSPFSSASFLSSSPSRTSTPVLECRSCEARDLCGGGCAFSHSLVRTQGQEDALNSAFCSQYKSFAKLALETYPVIRRSLSAQYNFAKVYENAFAYQISACAKK